MGKYDEAVKTLPKFKPEPDAYQARVDLTKRQYIHAATETTEETTFTASELCAALVDARRKKDAIEEQLSLVNLHVEALNQMIADAFEAEELQSIKLGDGSSVSIQLKPYAGFEDKDAFRVWCIAQGLEREMHLHPSTAQSLVNQRLLAGEELPPGVKAFVKPTAVVRGK